MEVSRRIYLSLPKGQDNAIKAEELAAKLGFSSTRSLQKAIEEERRSGALILSGSNGYYAPVTVAEVRESYIRNKARATSLLRNLKEHRRWLIKNDSEFTGDNIGQMSIDDFIGEPKEDRTAKIRKGIF